MTVFSLAWDGEGEVGRPGMLLCRLMLPLPSVLLPTLSVSAEIPLAGEMDLPTEGTGD